MRRAAPIRWAFVAVALACGILGGCKGGEDPSLGAPVTTGTASPPTPTASVPDPLPTVPGDGALEVDAERFMADPCAAISDELRRELDAEGDADRDDDRCELEAADGVLAVEVQRPPAGAIAASADFQITYGEAVLPVRQELLGMGLQLDQGDTMLVAVFTDEISLAFNLPVDDLSDRLQEVLSRSVRASA